MKTHKWVRLKVIKRESDWDVKEYDLKVGDWYVYDTRQAINRRRAIRLGPDLEKVKLIVDAINSCPVRPEIEELENGLDMVWYEGDKCKWKRLVNMKTEIVYEYPEL